MKGNRVELDREDGLWIVRLVDGDDIVERSFIFNQGAQAYAEGQAYRLTGKVDYEVTTKAVDAGWNHSGRRTL